MSNEPSDDDAPLYDQAALDAAVAADRERICQALPGGRTVDPQWVADMVRAGPNVAHNPAPSGVRR